MQAHESYNPGNAAFAKLRFVIMQKGRPGGTALAHQEYSPGADQIVGFQAAGISRYPLPFFSTWPIEGKVKWKPTTVAFSAAAMS